MRNTTVLGSGTATISPATVTLATVSFATPAVAFAAGDRIHVRVTNPGTAGCAPTAHFDGAGTAAQLVHP